jgi:hypothetical protein
MRTKLIAVGLLVVAVRVSAQQPQRARQDCQPNTQVAQTTTPQGIDQRTREYDVVVNVPQLCVNSLNLKVNNLFAHLALDAAVANLLQVQAGADVSIAKVDLGIYGVRAQALLLVDLDNIVYAVDRTLSFIDNNPQVVRGVLKSVNNTVGTVGQIGNTLVQPGGVLSQTTNTLGQTLTRVVDQTGSIVERTLDTAGKVVSSRTVGSVLSLPLVSETTANTIGETTRTVRDSSGRVIEYVVDTAGKVLRTRVLSGGS